ncbi:2-phospho-L-lactate guanylyltransferase [Propionibacteriaceae bacterium Y1685]|uniref:2-phospho-L-lactate guanylyltransferase n=1 Tax=Microlunatus sp. Y1700 TaxID=3418487 RepID=UPI003B7D25B4
MISLVVPLKALSAAKSRFVAAAPALRQRLAWSMFCDTVTACAPVADQLIVVSDVRGVAAGLHRLGIEALVLPDPGTLNDAFVRGAAATDGATLVGAVMSDLPALSSPQLAEIVAGAGGVEHSFVSDADGTGTTMLFSTTTLDPQFNDHRHDSGSAARHREAGAVDLAAAAAADWTGARQDVDDPASLASAAAVGLGPHSRRLVDDKGCLGSYAPLTVVSSDGDKLIMVTDDGRRVSAPYADEQPDFQPRRGQRCHGVMGADSRVLSVWN